MDDSGILDNGQFYDPDAERVSNMIDEQLKVETLYFKAEMRTHMLSCRRNMRR